MSTTLRSAAGAATLLLAVPALASAHVTLQPKTAPAGSYTEFDVRVPTESETASTTKVSVQFPPGISYAAQEDQPGWKVTTTKSKLATPVKSDDGEITEQVDTMTFTGTGKGDGAIAPGAFKDFPIVISVPDKAGSTLTFKALQTYSDGSVVRWIGDASADKPAPTVALTAAADTTAAASTTPTSSAPTSSAPAATVKPGASKGLAIAGLVVGIIGVLLGGAALATNRKAA